MSFTHHQEQDMIARVSGCSENACACDKCKSMCRKTPCIGTPSDILKIARAGYLDSLVCTTWAAGIPYGLPPVEMVQPRYDEEKKACTFFTYDGKCVLHDLGLKPTEGRLANCKGQNASFEIGKLPVNFVVATSWTIKENLPMHIELMEGLLGIKKII
jgi:hypothetical protein